MRALWSRAAQIPGTCRCISCVSKSSAVARPRATGRLPRVWALGAPTSTFLYTVVFAAGLAIDAKTKLERNKQWEIAFAQLQEALDGPSEEAAKSDKATSSEESPEDWDGQNGSKDAGDKAKVDNDADAPLWDALRFDSRMPGTQTLDWPANTGPDLRPYNLPPESLWSPDVLRWPAMRRRHTRKKLAMQELSAGLLIHTMIRQINLGRFLDSAQADLRALSPFIRDIAALSDEQFQTDVLQIESDIERLHLVDVKSSAETIARQRVNITHQRVPSYYQDADGDFYDISTQMNNSIAHLLRKVDKANDRAKALAIARIAHNLLVSTAAPDLHTFNLLLSGFIQWRHPPLVDAVIAEFYRSKIRPNELTCKLILDFYAASSRPSHFSAFVAKMRGVGDALCLAHPRITINEASHGRLIRLSPDKVYQKVHPTPLVFDSLIRGVLAFAGFDRALDIYFEMKSDGWGLGIGALTRLLGDCVRRADWDGGSYVWAEINSVKTHVSRHQAARAYSHMLSLCCVTGHTVAFNSVLGEVARRGFEQRGVLEQAVRTTRWAEKGREGVAPAWAVDNLLIAVSAYVEGGGKEGGDGGAQLDEEEDYEGAPAAEEGAREEQRSEEQRSEEDEKELWSKWVEHELGEKPKDPKL